MASTDGKKDSRKYGTSQIRIKDITVCYLCKSSPLGNEVVYCPNCGFPQRGTEYEQRKFIIGRKMKNKDVNEEHGTVGIGKLILFLLGGVNGLLSIFPFREGDMIDGVVQVILGAIYIGLGLWAIKKPYPALLVGLILYLLFILLGAVLQPETLLSGIYLKFFVASSLVYGMAAVKKAEKLQAELELKKMDLSELQQGTTEENNN